MPYSSSSKQLSVEDGAQVVTGGAPTANDKSSIMATEPYIEDSPTHVSQMASHKKLVRLPRRIIVGNSSSNQSRKPHPHLSLMRSSYKRNRDEMLQKLLAENQTIQDARQTWRFTNPADSSQERFFEQYQ